MRKLLVALAAVAALAAQTTTFGPVAVDFRYSLTWTDPNPAGQVASWFVYATNTVGSRSMSSRSTTVPLTSLLTGSPAGTYTLYTTAVSVTGVEGDPGDQLLVVWPGGTGKLHGGKSPQANK